jgi:hypothetical protein
MWDKFELNLLSNAVGITSHKTDFSRYAAAYEHAVTHERLIY